MYVFGNKIFLSKTCSQDDFLALNSSFVFLKIQGHLTYFSIILIRCEVRIDLATTTHMLKSNGVKKTSLSTQNNAYIAKSQIWKKEIAH